MIIKTIIILLLFIPLSSADLLRIGDGGTELAITYNGLDEFFNSNSSSSVDEGSGGGSGGGGTSPDPAVGPYDVSVKTLKGTYPYKDSWTPTRNSVIEVIVSVNNTGRDPDSDAAMTINLIGEDDLLFKSIREELLEVPPGKTDYYREIDLPYAAPLGQWSVEVIYETSVQAPIVSYDYFTVRSYLWYEPLFYSFVVSIVLLLGIYFIRRRRGRIISNDVDDAST